MYKSAYAVVALLALGACHTPNIPDALGERELRPPRQGITVGSLYYVRESPTSELSAPANLEQLCTVNLAAYGVTSPQQHPVADVDLLSKYDASGSLEGVKTSFLSLGLSGGLNDYFEYKLVNAKRSEIDYNQAEQIYNARAFRRDCRTWRGNIGGHAWGIYQIRSITTGDLTFSRKWGGNVTGEAAVKLRALEPKLKAELKRTAQMGFSGKAMVVSFGPITRN